MNRFRRKSESRKSTKSLVGQGGEDSSTSSSSASASASSKSTTSHLRPTILPPQDDFRTSLILPHLTKRFTLLRSESGQLVDLVTIQQNLEAQRKTGALSTYEVEAVLAQWRLQSLYEQSTSSSSSSQPHPYYRTDSVLSDSSISHNSHSHSNEERENLTSVSYSSSSSSTPLPLSRRSGGGNGNSMFGGRVASRNQLRLPKSTSESSVKSLGGGSTRNSTKSFVTETEAEEEEEEEEPTPTRSEMEMERTGSNESGELRAVDKEEEEAEEEEPSTEEDEEGAEKENSAIGLSVPILSTKQLRRISAALDSMEADLSAIYRLPPTPPIPVIIEEPSSRPTPSSPTPSNSNSNSFSPPLPLPIPIEELTTTSSLSSSSNLEEPTSPISDTEPVDPFLHSNSNPKTPTAGTFGFSRKLSLPGTYPGLSPLLFSSPTPSPQPQTEVEQLASPSLSFSHETETEVEVEVEPTSPTSPTSLITPSSTTSSFTGLLSRIPNQRFSTTSTNSYREGERESGGPFDFDFENYLATGVVIGGEGGEESSLESGETEEALFVEGEERKGGEGGERESVSSVGSSWHPSRVDSLVSSDEEDGLLREEGEELTPQKKKLVMEVVEMDRRPSEELMKEIVEGTQVGDLDLEDLRVLQDALVKSVGGGSKRFEVEKQVEVEREVDVEREGVASHGLGFMVGQDEDLEEDDEEGVRRLEMMNEDGIGRAFGGEIDGEWEEGEEEEEEVGEEEMEGTPSTMNDTPSSGSGSEAFEYANNLPQPTSPLSSTDEKEELLTGVITPSIIPLFPSPPSSVSSLPTSVPLSPVDPSTFPLPTPTPRTNLRLPRNQAATQSVLIRDVRDQANNATLKLKTSSSSGGGRSGSGGGKSGSGSIMRRNKSVRNREISGPTLIQPPEAMAVVPITQTSKVEEVERKGSLSGKSGLGSRFKKLLKKQSREGIRHQLNGDEVTPFVDLPRVGETTSVTGGGRPTSPPPFTPPSQTIATFGSVISNDSPASTSNSTRPSTDFPSTPSDDPRFSSTASPLLHPLSPSSPNPQPSPNLSISNSSGSTKSLGRFVSKFRRPRGASDASAKLEELHSGNAIPVTSLSEAFGNSPVMFYDASLPSNSNGLLSSPFLEMDGEGEGEVEGPMTAPLASTSTSRMGPEPLKINPSTSTSRSVWSTTNSAPLPTTTDGRNSTESASSSTKGRPNTTVSMMKLRDAASDLGMAPESVEEFVDLSYGHSPTSSPTSQNVKWARRHTHTRGSPGGSDTSFHLVGVARSGSGSQSSGSRNHRRGDSQSSTSVSAVLHRANSTATTESGSKWIQDRVSTPPPTSTTTLGLLASSSTLEPVPSIPPSLSTPSPSDEDAIMFPSYRLSRVSLGGGSTTDDGSLRPPKSPGVMSTSDSTRSSHYAGSIYDLYGGDGDRSSEVADTLTEEEGEQGGSLGDEEEEEDVEATPQLPHSARMDDQGLGQEPELEKMLEDFVGGLKGNRLSSDHYSFHSRNSSTDSSADVSSPPHHSFSAATADTIQLFLRNKPKQPTSKSTTKPSLPFLDSYANESSARPAMSNRFPSIFLRDEERLQILAKEGGIAAEEQGRFFVRPATKGYDGAGI